jgi:hypothetical protein
MNLVHTVYSANNRRFALVALRFAFGRVCALSIFRAAKCEMMSKLLSPPAKHFRGQPACTLLLLPTMGLCRHTIGQGPVHAEMNWF